MPVSPTYPGVYIEEIPSGVKTITGVSTSIAVFIGRAKSGPLNEPVLCLNFGDFEKTFSSEYAGSDMVRAVRLFFQNGGTQCYVMRIAEGAVQSSVRLKNEGRDDVLEVKAKSYGTCGDDIRLAVTYNRHDSESTFNLEVFRWLPNRAGEYDKKDPEYWPNLSMDPTNARYAEDFINQNSKLVEVVADPGLGPDDAGYSQSGRYLSNNADEFREEWLSIIGTTGPAVTGAAWSGTSEITSHGTYTGTTPKTFTFTISTITPAGSITIPPSTDELLTVNWTDDSGGTGSFDIDDSYSEGDEREVADNIALFFGAGSLQDADTFTLEAFPRRNFRISVDGGSTYENVDLSTSDFTSPALDADAVRTAIEDAINEIPGVSVDVTFENHPDVTVDSGTAQVLKISSSGSDVRIEPATMYDLAGPLMLGAAQGGIEVSRYAKNRPAPNGVVFNPDNLDHFANLEQTAFDTISIEESNLVDLEGKLQTATTSASSRMYEDGYPSSITGHKDGIREKMSIIAEVINEKNAAELSFTWIAELWGSRLALIPREGNCNRSATLIINATDSSGAAVNIGSYFTTSVRFYSLGTGGKGDYQSDGLAGDDGRAPTLTNYRNAFNVLEKEVDLFNLMILPADADHSADTATDLWGPASVFCKKRRAFLLVDPPSSWSSVQEIIKPEGVLRLRRGLVKDHSAIFYPRITIRENGLNKQVGPSGAIAGLMSRIDVSRGVWKAPAGTEADLRGVVGLECRLSDDENGVLNPRAVNALRVFPNGLVNWGARTMDGDDDNPGDYKYIPIRRLALYIEESLYRGTKWVVFEPNDEPLWAKIRMNVGVFMTRLFNQGAFQGTSPNKAFFVKCDAETTTPSDQNLGIVNIEVGFAPLKPAEFVIVKIQQIAGDLV